MPLEVVGQSVLALLILVINLLVAAYGFVLSARDTKYLPFAVGPLGVAVFGLVWFLALLDPNLFEPLQAIGAAGGAIGALGFSVDAAKGSRTRLAVLASTVPLAVVAGWLLHRLGLEHEMGPLALRIAGWVFLAQCAAFHLQGSGSFHRRMWMSATAPMVAWFGLALYLWLTHQDGVDPVVAPLFAVELMIGVYVVERKVELHLLVSRGITYVLLSMAVAFVSAFWFRRLGYPVDLVQVTATVAIALIAAVLFLGLGELATRRVEALLFPDQAKAARLLAASKTELAALRVRLDRAERLAIAGQLAASVAHEIKNPLAALTGYAQLLSTQRERVDPDAREAFDKALSIIREEAQRIDQRVGELLGRGQPEPRAEVVDLNRLVRDVLAMVQTDPLLSKISARLDPQLATVRGNSDALRGALLNLLRNAGEATPAPGGGIEVSTKTEGDRAIVEVLDRGTGLPRGDPETLFKAFFTTKEGGTGLGLAIARSAIEAAGGRLTLRPRTDGAGSCARVELVCVPPERAHALERAEQLS